MHVAEISRCQTPTVVFILMQSQATFMISISIFCLFALADLSISTGIAKMLGNVASLRCLSVIQAVCPPRLDISTMSAAFGLGFRDELPMSVVGSLSS